MVQAFQKNRTTSSLRSTIQYTVSKTVDQACFLRLVFLLFFISACATSEFNRVSRFERPPKITQPKPPSQPQVTPPSLTKGIRFLNDKQYAKALQIFEQEISRESGDTYFQAQFYKGFILYKTNKYKKAYNQLSLVISENAPSQWVTRSLMLQWKILVEQKSQNKFQKLQILSSLIQYSDEMTVKTKSRDLASSLIEKLSSSHLKSFSEDSSLMGVRDILLFHLGRYHVQNKSYQKALSFFKELLNYSSNNIQIENKAQQYIEALTFRTKVAPQTVATILPLTGKYQKIGKRCLNGLQLGLGLLDSKPSEFKLIVKDSKSSNLSIQENIREVLFKHKAIGLIGGVVSQSAVKLAQEAQNFMIPTILLSQKSKLTHTKEFVFQNAITNDYIIENLVNTLLEQNHKKLAILYPNDPFGVEYANLFWDHVEKRGGEIVSVQTYKTDETDFNNAIRRLTGTYYFEDRDEEFREILKEKLAQDTKKRNKTKLRELLPPIVNFSAVFIPDSIKSLHRISPYFKSQQIKEVIFTGPSFWNSPLLLKQKKNLIEGALFVDALITNHPDFKSSQFFKSFRATFNQDPGLFEFLSYQSALAFRQAISTGVENREELRKYLSQIEKIPSPIGQVSISSNREFIYPITQFSVKNSTITPL